MFSKLVLYLYILIFPKMHCIFVTCAEENLSDRDRERICRTEPRALGLVFLLFIYVELYFKSSAVMQRPQHT